MGGAFRWSARLEIRSAPVHLGCSGVFGRDPRNRGYGRGGNGWHGVAGASAALDGRISLSRGIVQLAGDIAICSVDGLKSAALQSPQLLSLLIRHEQTVYAQAQQSAACLAKHHIQARLCRWLLRARDLAGCDTLNFTQEYLAEMLGVQRSSVTVVAHTLQAAGLIEYSRGKIQIVDVDALHDGACECYETMKRHYGRLLGPTN
jgi:hypothetical protein